MKTFLFLFIFGICSTALIAQRDTTNPKFRQRDEMAKTKLANFSTTLNESNMKNFGFASMDDLKNAALSKPLEIAIVPLDQLRNYTSNTNVTSLITHSLKYIYPIINTKSQQVTNAMTVDSPGSQWSIVSMGRNKPIAIAAYSQYKASPNNNYFVASIIALNLNFISYYSNNTLMMIPVVSDPQNSLEAGKPVPASRIFTVYAVAAKKYNGLPM